MLTGPCPFERPLQGGREGIAAAAHVEDHQGPQGRRPLIRRAGQGGIRAGTLEGGQGGAGQEAQPKEHCPGGAHQLPAFAPEWLSRMNLNSKVASTVKRLSPASA